MAFSDLREFLDVLDREGELVRVDRPISMKLEVGRALRKAYARGGPAVIFAQTGTPFPLVAGLYSTRRKAALAFETTEEELTEKVISGLANPIPPTVCPGPAPAQEVVESAGDVDLHKFPVPIYSPDDGGPFITPGIVVSKDPDTGVPDIGHYRFQVFGRDTMSFLAQPFHRFGKHLEKARRMGMHSYEAALVVGVDPVLAYTCQVQTSDTTDDFTVAGGLRGAAVELVPATSIDLSVPATAEVIFEMEVDLDEMVQEGPLGEYTGYYTPASPKPVARVKAVTRRKQPYFQGLLTGKPVTENHILKQVPFEASLYRALHAQFPTLSGISVRASAGVSFYIVLGIRPRYAGEARQAIMAAMASNVRPKFVIAVDPDVAVQDSADVEWAMAFRVRPERDVFIVGGMPAGPLDPSVPEAERPDMRLSGSVGIDATRGVGEAFAKVADIEGWQGYVFPELDGHRGPERY